EAGLFLARRQIVEIVTLARHTDGEGLVVGRNSEVERVVPALAQDVNKLPSPDVPDPSRSTLDRRQEVAVLREDQLGYLHVVVRKIGRLASGLHVPEGQPSRCCVPLWFCDRQQPAVR